MVFNTDRSLIIIVSFEFIYSPGHAMRVVFGADCIVTK